MMGYQPSIRKPGPTFSQRFWRVIRNLLGAKEPPLKASDFEMQLYERQLAMAKQMGELRIRK